MTRTAALHPDPAPIAACTVSRDIRNFDLLVEDMGAELGENWGDLGLQDIIDFFDHPEAAGLEFIAIAVDGEDEENIGFLGRVVRTAKSNGVKVIVVVKDVSPIALHQLMREGADDFVPYPLPEGALHDAIDRARRADPPPPAAAEAAHRRATASKPDRDGVVLPVHGLAGGVGASTFAVNLAWELTLAAKDRDKRVCLIDLDLQFGSVATYLDLPRKEAVFELLSDISAMDSDSFMQALQTYGNDLHVLTAPADILPLDLISSDDVRTLIDMARGQFDFVIVDMPTTLVQWSEAVLTKASLYFALLELDMRSAQNTVRLIRALRAEELPFERLRFAMNRAPKRSELSARSRVKRMAESLDIAIDILLPDSGKMVAQSGDEGVPLANSAGKSPLRREIQKLAVSLFELTAQAAHAES
ncbi:Type II/IV secretion system ATPase TadZ/CpaE, associated with Flp pilus assembly [Rhodovulum sp. P5]|uniref:AAA family ATPase n=1 Tax=Rhodovulum sp. P5 TaxID=1564506 RepID=UPI0009C28E62|nr:AAA family ATPase [Rhodovulum sp. P5]ARE41385.1 Type II/IV secretion system ATPase TadZ/CpaE, associated with Flp pilus assembly [Rhodovulum sp. P5]